MVDEQEEARQSELREKEPNLFVVLQKGLPKWATWIMRLANWIALIASVKLFLDWLLSVL